MFPSCHRVNDAHRKLGFDREHWKDGRGLRMSDTPRGAGGLMSWTASRRLVSEFRCRALRASLLHSELCAEAIRLVLFADVGADLLQFEPDGGDGVTAGPEMLACEVSFFTAQTGDCDSTLPLQKSDDRSHRMLGWNRDTHMHMIRHQVTLDNLAFLLPGQRVENCAQLPARLPEDGFPSSFGHEHYVILAVPFRMG